MPKTTTDASFVACIRASVTLDGNPIVALGSVVVTGVIPIMNTIGCEMSVTSARPTDTTEG